MANIKKIYQNLILITIKNQIIPNGFLRGSIPRWEQRKFSKKMAKFKKKLRIENATSFKLEYYDDSNELKTKTFKSYKLMEQFHNRQTDFLYFDHHRYALIDGIWHRFIKLESPFVFQSNLEVINKNFEDIHLHKQINED